MNTTEKANQILDYLKGKGWKRTLDVLGSVGTKEEAIWAAKGILNSVKEGALV